MHGCSVIDCDSDGPAMAELVGGRAGEVRTLPAVDHLPLSPSLPLLFALQIGLVGAVTYLPLSLAYPSL